MNYFFRKNNKVKQNQGQAILIVVIMCTSIFLMIVLGIVDPIVNELQLSNNLLNSKASFYAAESNTEDAVYRVKNDMVTNFAEPLSLNINNLVSTINFSDSSGMKVAEAVGNFNNNYRKIRTRMASGVGADIYYGVLSGNGGLTLTGNARIDGDVYTNGSVVADNGVVITGSVTAANPSTGFATVGGGTYIGSLKVGTTGVGNVWAHNVVGVLAEGKIYCKSGSVNNKTCDNSRSDPSSKNLPFNDNDISVWKNYASAGQVHVGDYNLSSTTETIGPMKITGNLIVDNNETLNLSGTVWVQGNVTFANSSKLRLTSDFDVSGGVLVSDGLISLGGTANFDGSGMSGSYPLIITTSSSTNAITVNGASGAVVLVAQNGTIHLAGSTGARALVGKHVVITNGGSVTYDPALSNFNFSNGTSSEWKISSWKEVQ